MVLLDNPNISGSKNNLLTLIWRNCPLETLLLMWLKSLRGSWDFGGTRPDTGGFPLQMKTLLKAQGGGRNILLFTSSALQFCSQTQAAVSGTCGTPGRCRSRSQGMGLRWPIVTASDCFVRVQEMSEAFRMASGIHMLSTHLCRPCDCHLYCHRHHWCHFQNSNIYF